MTGRAGRNISVIYISVLCDENNLQLNESVVRAQLDTHRLHHQTSHCQAKREEKGEKSVDTESIWSRVNCIQRCYEGGEIYTELGSLTAARCR